MGKSTYIKPLLEKKKLREDKAKAFEKMAKDISDGALTNLNDIVDPISYAAYCEQYEVDFQRYGLKALMDTLIRTGILDQHQFINDARFDISQLMQIRMASLLERANATRAEIDVNTEEGGKHLMKKAMETVGKGVKGQKAEMINAEYTKTVKPPVPASA